MSALTEFCKKAKMDSTIKAELEAVKKEFAGKLSEDAVYGAVIDVAKKHGITLTQADFKVQAGSLDEAELKAVSGGCYNGCGWKHECLGPSDWPGEDAGADYYYERQCK